MQVATFQNSRTRATLTQRQVATLEDAGVWLRNEHGYLNSTHCGWHEGEPSITDADVVALVAGDEAAGMVAR